MKENSLSLLMPRYLSNRFLSLNKYVWDNLFPEGKFNELSKDSNKQRKKRKIKYLRETANEASLVVFIFSIKNFFDEGTKAATSAVDTFKELQVSGFKIGNTFFSERNENVLKGSVLAMELLNEIQNSELKALISNSRTMTEIIEKYKIRINNVRSLSF